MGLDELKVTFKMLNIRWYYCENKKDIYIYIAKIWPRKYIYDLLKQYNFNYKIFQYSHSQILCIYDKGE